MIEPDMVVPPKDPTPSSYEYHIESLPTDVSDDELTARCNKLGEEGWGLVYVSPYTSDPEKGIGAGNSVRFWFMRGLK